MDSFFCSFLFFSHKTTITSSNEQGPFTSEQMASWHASGHLPGTLKVRRGGSLSFDSHYTTIQMLFPFANDQGGSLSSAFINIIGQNDMKDAIYALEQVLKLMNEDDEDASYNK